MLHISLNLLFSKESNLFIKTLRAESNAIWCYNSQFVSTSHVTEMIRNKKKLKCCCLDDLFRFIGAQLSKNKVNFEKYIFTKCTV